MWEGLLNSLKYEEPPAKSNPSPFCLPFFLTDMVPHTPNIPLKKKSKKKKRQEKVPLSHTNSKFLLFYIALHEYHWYIHKVHRIKIFFSPMWQISIPFHILQFANYPWIPEYLKPEKGTYSNYLTQLRHEQYQELQWLLTILNTQVFIRLTSCMHE